MSEYLTVELFFAEGKGMRPNARTKPSNLRPKAVTRAPYAAPHNKGVYPMKLAETLGAVLVTVGIFTSQLALIVEGLPV